MECHIIGTGSCFGGDGGGVRTLQFIGPLGPRCIVGLDEYLMASEGLELWPSGFTPCFERVAVTIGEHDPRRPAVMDAGSCIFFLGTLWHGGGANRSDRSRLAVTAQYCEPWLRPQEAFTLSTSREVAAEVSDDIRRLLGYSIHPPFLGMVDGMHPLRLLDV